MEGRLEDNLKYGIPIHGLLKAFNENTSNELKSFLITYNVLSIGIMFSVLYPLAEIFLK